MCTIFQCKPLSPEMHQNELLNKYSVFISQCTFYIYIAYGNRRSLNGKCSISYRGLPLFCYFTFQKFKTYLRFIPCLLIFESTLCMFFRICHFLETMWHMQKNIFILN